MVAVVPGVILAPTFSVLVDAVEALVPPGLVEGLGPGEPGQAPALVEAVHALELADVLADTPAGFGVLDVVLALAAPQVLLPLGAALHGVRAL